MSKLVNRVLLVDDSDATNFFNKTIINKTECVRDVIVKKNGAEALAYITSEEIPDIIFLDINMPVMNGWEFLSEFNKIDTGIKSPVIILMIGASLSVQEKEKVTQYPLVKELREKMLTKAIVTEIIALYFSRKNSNDIDHKRIHSVSKT